MNSLKRKVYLLLEPTRDTHDPRYYVDVFIIALIILNVIAVVLESDVTLLKRYSYFFRNFEIFSVTIFTIEYLLRLWTITENPKYSHPLYGRIKFIFSFEGLVDLLSILPFYIGISGKVDLRILRILRLMRVFRILKVAKYSSALNIITTVFRRKKEEILVSLSLVLIVMLLSSTILYYAEREAQPNDFASIPKAMWWSIATLSTVGYGDIVPITTIGKIFGGIISLTGIAIFALPSGILASGFSDEIQRRRERTAKETKEE